MIGYEREICYKR